MLYALKQARRLMLATGVALFAFVACDSVTSPEESSVSSSTILEIDGTMEEDAWAYDVIRKPLDRGRGLPAEE